MNYSLIPLRASTAIRMHSANWKQQRRPSKSSTRSRRSEGEGGKLINFDKAACSDLEFGLSREWLETNGLGGFACGTVAGANTRRYHGLLTAAINPPAGRILLLSKVEETLVLGERRIDLSTNEYAD